ncbi:MAG: hypothetical protein HY822_07780 [Acidobacteria bacterium]|nr:hypothetical protein [Acidobacteriota bacterium]
MVMTVTLNLNPDLQRRLTREAQARGMALDAYLQALLESEGSYERHPETDLQQFRAMMNALAEGASQLPPLPSDSFRRESIYRDHD